MPMFGIVARRARLRHGFVGLFGNVGRGFQGVSIDLKWMPFFMKTRGPSSLSQIANTIMPVFRFPVKEIHEHYACLRIIGVLPARSPSNALLLSLQALRIVWGIDETGGDNVPADSPSVFCELACAE